MQQSYFHLFKPKVFTNLCLLALLSSFLSAQTGTVGALSIGDSIFTSEGNGGIDVTNYDLDIHWDNQTGHIKGKATLNIKTTQKLSAFSLDFHSLKVTSITVDTLPEKFSRKKDKLLIVLPKLLEPNISFILTVHYEGKPSEIQKSVSAGWHTVKEGARALSEPNSAKNWFPCNNHPRDKAVYAFHITVPKEYDVVANGIPQKSIHTKTNTTYQFKTREPMASYLTLISIGHYDHEVLKAKDGTPIYNYYYKGIAKKDKEVFTQQANIMAFFSEKFGTYPFASAGIVSAQGESILAYETQTRPFFGTPTSEQMLAHELAHQWFGDLVSLDEWKESWLKEGFATYSAALWFEHKQGKDYMEKWVRGTFESLMGIQRLPKENMSKMLKAFEIKERILSSEEVTKLIDMGTKGKTESKSFKRALAHIPKEGISSYKLDAVFKEMSFPYFDLIFNQYVDFMNIISGEKFENNISFDDLVATLGQAPRDVRTLSQIYSSGVYARGALAMHTLRIKVGDTKFFNILQTYFKRYTNSHANSVDFEAVATEVSGENLDDFFKAWLEDKLIPDIPKYGLYKKNYAK